MDWLVTVDSSADLQQLKGRLAELGCGGLENAAPIPLGDNEQVIEVSGPPDLAARAGRLPGVRKVSPNSRMTYYR
jgi:hypothetical protein